MNRQIYNLNQETVSSVMVPPSVVLDIYVEVIQAVNLMLANQVEYAIVTEANFPRYILASNDLISLYYMAQYEDSTEFMHSPLHQIIEDQSLLVIPPTMTLYQAMRVCVEKKLSAIPVVQNGRLLGIVTPQRILDYLTCVKEEQDNG